MKKKYMLPRLFGVIVALSIVVLIVKCSLGSDPQSRYFQADGSYESSVVNFFDTHPELGAMKFPFVEDATDWAEGKRLWVYTDKGNYLAYFIDKEIVTVYHEMPDQSRIEIYSTYDSKYTAK